MVNNMILDFSLSQKKNFLPYLFFTSFLFLLFGLACSMEFLDRGLPFTKMFCTEVDILSDFNVD
jgi:hypothetical protein